MSQKQMLCTKFMLLKITMNEKGTSPTQGSIPFGAELWPVLVCHCHRSGYTNFRESSSSHCCLVEFSTPGKYTVKMALGYIYQKKPVVICILLVIYANRQRKEHSRIAIYIIKIILYWYIRFKNENVQKFGCQIFRPNFRRWLFQRF